MRSATSKLHVSPLCRSLPNPRLQVQEGFEVMNDVVNDRIPTVFGQQKIHLESFRLLNAI